jgi:hypothetical protein
MGHICYKGSMQKWIVLFCLFLGTAVFAEAKTEPAPQPQAVVTVHAEEETLAKAYWKFHNSAYLGYRRDRQQFNSFGSGPLNTRLAFKDRNSMILTASSHAEFKSVVGYLRATYGWLIDGETTWRVPGNVPPLSFGPFDLGAGYEVDVRAALGWRFKLVEKKDFNFSFIPGGGYRYAHMMNYPEGVQRISLSGTTNFASSQFPKPNQQDWFGPYVDGKLEFLCWNFWEWDFFGQYHWPYLVSKSSNETNIYTYDGGTLTSGQLNRTDSVIKSGGLHMLLGGTHMKFAFGTGWAVGAYFEAATTWGNGNNHATLRQEQLLNAPPATTITRAADRTTVRWEFFSVSITANHRF